MFFRLVVTPEQGASDQWVDGAPFIVLGSVQFMCAPSRFGAGQVREQGTLNLANRPSKYIVNFEPVWN
jgi:hypothetical protein